MLIIPAAETIAAVAFYCSRCGARLAWTQMHGAACEEGDAHTSHNWVPLGDAAALVARMHKGAS